MLIAAIPLGKLSGGTLFVDGYMGKQEEEGEKKWKENRASAQKKVDQVVSTLKLTPDERQQLHNAITGNDG